MKQAFRNLAAVLCMLVLIASSASCMEVTSHNTASCSHCAKHQPINQQTPVCCEAHHQPSATATAITIEQPAQATIPNASVIRLSALAIFPLPAQHIWPPPLSPHLTLRI
jgi:hypothetical protein